MRWKLHAFILVLIFIPIATISYKSQKLELSFLPKPIFDEWLIQVQLDGQAFVDTQSLLLPSPVTNQKQTLENIVIQNSSLEYEFLDDASILNFKGNISQLSSFGYQFQVSPESWISSLPEREVWSPQPDKVKTFLETKPISRSDLNALRKIENVILTGRRDRVDALKRIFFYVSEEITKSSQSYSIKEAIELGKASSLTRAQIFTLLSRRSGIPTRITTGVLMQENRASRFRNEKLKLDYFVEAYINKKWYPIDIEGRQIGSYPDKLILISRNIEAFENWLALSDSIQILSRPTHVNRYNLINYQEDLKRSDSFFSSWSLYRLPLAVQTKLQLILLLPFGAVILSIFRNLVGVPTFGIFTPILLTIFFLETPLTLSIGFILLILALGFIQRVYLDKLYLLAVPRISILLTLVIVAYVVFLVSNPLDSFAPAMQSSILSYFPVVIITSLIERFSVDIIEEGSVNTFKKLLGTLSITVVCYLSFISEVFRLLIFTHPELILTAIAANLWIGNYKGYRVSEFFRFKELASKFNL